MLDCRWALVWDYRRRSQTDTECQWPLVSASALKSELALASQMGSVRQSRPSGFQFPWPIDHRDW